MPTKNKIKPSDIPKMLKLKNKGWSFQRIADKYKVHHSAIFHKFSKLKLKYPRNRVGAKKRVGKVKCKYQKSTVFKPQKTFKDYLACEAERVKKMFTK